MGKWRPRPAKVDSWTKAKKDRAKDNEGKSCPPHDWYEFYNDGQTRTDMCTRCEKRHRYPV